MCNCSKEIPQTQIAHRVYNLNQCEGVNLSLLESWKKKTSYVLINNLSSFCNVQNEEVLEIDNILNQWIVVKKQNPGSCEFFENLKVCQSLISKLIKAKI